MRVVFAGTPPFAARALDAIAAQGHEVVLVLTQPDRPAGRGLKLTPSAVAAAAAQGGLRVEKPPTLKALEAQAILRAADADVMVVAAYGLLLPPAVLAIPPLGCLNIHASLLPRWRGAAPIHRAILAGDRETGISIMQMDAGLDTGPVLLARSHAIDARATTRTLTEALAALGAAAIGDALARIRELRPRPQESAHATHAGKVAKEEARIDWKMPSELVDRQVRAFDPAPGAEGTISGEKVKIWGAEPVLASGDPGEVLRADEDGLVVACGTGALRILELQRPGGRRLPVAQFLRGRAIAGGNRPV